MSRIPYRWRRLHRLYAAMFGYFWLHCPVCGQGFGGHESQGIIDDPQGGPGCGLMICNACTKAGRADRRVR